MSSLWTICTLLLKQSCAPVGTLVGEACPGPAGCKPQLQLLRCSGSLAWLTVWLAARPRHSCYKHAVRQGWHPQGWRYFGGLLVLAEAACWVWLGSRHFGGASWGGFTGEYQGRVRVFILAPTSLGPAQQEGKKKSPTRDFVPN